MNNRDWLYTLQPRDRTKWLNAEHVEPNDRLSPEKGVSDPDGGSNVAYIEKDSREKLEADVYRAADEMDRFYCGGKFIDTRKIIGWLDRQAAITERECLERATGERVGWDCAECAEGLGRELDARCDPLKERIAELQAKVDGLTAERDMWRDKCGRMLDAAHEIERIAEVDE